MIIPIDDTRINYSRKKIEDWTFLKFIFHYDMKILDQKACNISL